MPIKRILLSAGSSIVNDRLRWKPLRVVRKSTAASMLGNLAKVLTTSLLYFVSYKSDKLPIKQTEAALNTMPVHVCVKVKYSASEKNQCCNCSLDSVCQLFGCKKLFSIVWRTFKNFECVLSFRKASISKHLEACISRYHIAKASSYHTSLARKV